MFFKRSAAGSHRNGRSPKTTGVIMFATMRDDVVLGKLGALAMPCETKVESQGRPAGGLLHRLKVWQARRAVAAQLYQMNERELNDIGLSYADIPDVVRTVY